jgi:hypothetical protein
MNVCHTLRKRAEGELTLMKRMDRIRAGIGGGSFCSMFGCNRVGGNVSEDS